MSPDVIALSHDAGRWRLPRVETQRELPAQFIDTVLVAACRIVRWLEILLRPRLSFLHEQWLYRRIAKTLVKIAGLLLLLPLPIPLTNQTGFV